MARKKHEKSKKKKGSKQEDDGYTDKKKPQKSFTKTKNKNGSNEDAAFRTQLMTIGLEIIVVDSDGNCLFRALSDQLYCDSGQKWNQVRQSIVEFERMNEDAIRPFVEDDEPWDEYLERMARDGEWGGNLELYAASQMYRCNIVIHQLQAPRLEILCPNVSRTLHLSYHGESHYNSVKSTDGAQLPNIDGTAQDSLEKKLSRACPRATIAEINRTLETHDCFDDALAFLFELRGKDDGITDEHTQEENHTTPSADKFHHVDQNVSSTIKKKKIKKKTKNLSTSTTEENQPPKRGSACPCGSGKTYKKCCRPTDLRKKRLLVNNNAPTTSVDEGSLLQSTPLGALRI
uniref:OTU domain-containing protein n=1 Tax=Aureoumbra lagunensis TaxID=44058 RepID=A0A7S3JRN2_9STRA